MKREDRSYFGGQELGDLAGCRLGQESVGDLTSLGEADFILTDLEARKTCWWGTLQVSTAQLLRYMSPISLRTLNAGRHGEKKAPILQPRGGQLVRSGFRSMEVLTPWRSCLCLKNCKRPLQVRDPCPPPPGDDAKSSYRWVAVQYCSARLTQACPACVSLSTPS